MLQTIPKSSSASRFSNLQLQAQIQHIVQSADVSGGFCSNDIDEERRQSLLRLQNIESHFPRGLRSLKLFITECLSVQFNGKKVSSGGRATKRSQLYNELLSNKRMYGGHVYPSGRRMDNHSDSASTSSEEMNHAFADSQKSKKSVFFATTTIHDTPQYTAIPLHHNSRIDYYQLLQ